MRGGSSFQQAARAAGRGDAYVRSASQTQQQFGLLGQLTLPLARQAAEVTRVAYLNGKSQSLDVITALRTVREVTAMHQNHLQDYLVAVAELEGVLGRPLGELRETKNSN